MTDFIPTETSVRARRASIVREFDELVRKLIDLRVLRKSMVANDLGIWVIYTEDGPKDLYLSRLAPCLKMYPGNCMCYTCAQEDDDEEPVCDECEGDGWVYKRIDVDAEKRVPCECGLGDPND